MCYNKACASNRKSIPRDKMEDEFEAILQSMQPTENLIAIARTMFKHAWSQRMSQFKANARSLERDIAKTDSQIDRLLDRIVDADNPRVIAACENKIAKLEKQKLIPAEKLANSDKPKHGFDEMFELALKFLSNPWKLWDSGQMHLRRTVLRLAFADRMAYSRENGFRTRNYRYHSRY